MAEAVQEQETAAEIVNELEEPRWAVISFERREGTGLTYPQAAQLLSELDTRKVAGLAIVTDEAAAKVSD
jgi:hypothetical protein